MRDDECAEATAAVAKKHVNCPPRSRPSAEGIREERLCEAAHIGMWSRQAWTSRHWD
jgi:hypothetical protein